MNALIARNVWNSRNDFKHLHELFDEGTPAQFANIL